MTTGAGEGVITIMFTDVVGSTDLTTRYGDDAARQLMELPQRLIREHVASHGGREEDSIGDGFMITFPSPRKAVTCAIAIQHALADHARAHPEERVSVRIGLNVGEVLGPEGHPFGAAVNAAARVSAHARSGEILVADSVRQLAGTVPGVAFRYRGRFPLKGFPERWRLYEAIPADAASGGPATRVSRRRWFARRAVLAAALTALLGGGATAVVLALTGDGAAEQTGGRGADGAGPPTGEDDPPVILPGRAIGGVTLGMPEDEAVGLYGEPDTTRDWTSSGRTYSLLSYELHGSRFRIATYDGSVVSISTTSPYYSMENGTAVGEHSPNPLTDGVLEEQELSWREYVFEDVGPGCSMWSARGFGAVTELLLPSHFSGRIAGVRIVAREHREDVPREIGRCR